jgi:hypothetical protein
MKLVDGSVTGNRKTLQILVTVLLATQKQWIFLLLLLHVT